jgi:hypothetical protein
VGNNCLWGTLLLLNNLNWACKNLMTKMTQISIISQGRQIVGHPRFLRMMRVAKSGSKLQWKQESVYLQHTVEAMRLAMTTWSFENPFFSFFNSSQLFGILFFGGKESFFIGDSKERNENRDCSYQADLVHDQQNNHTILEISFYKHTQ